MAASGDAVSSRESRESREANFLEYVSKFLQAHGTYISEQMAFLANPAHELDVHKFFQTHTDIDSYHTFCLVAAYIKMMHSLGNLLPADREMVKETYQKLTEDDEWLASDIKRLKVVMENLHDVSKFEVQDDVDGDSPIDTSEVTDMWEKIGKTIIPMLRELVKEVPAYECVRSEIEHTWACYLWKVQQVAYIHGVMKHMGDIHM